MQVVEVNHRRGLPVKVLMPPFFVVEFKVAAQASSEFCCVCIGFKVNIFVLDASPKTFDKAVILPPTLTVHANSDVVGIKDICKDIGCKLATLIRVEYFRTAVSVHLLHGINAEGAVERIGQPPRHYHPTCPVHDNNEIEKSFCHREIGDVGGPHLIRSNDGKDSQQVRILAMAGVRNRQSRFHNNTSMPILRVNRRT